MQSKKYVIDIIPPRRADRKPENNPPPSVATVSKLPFKEENSSFFTPLPSYEMAKEAPPERTRIPRGIRLAAFCVCGVVFAAIFFSAFGFWNLKKTIAETSPLLYERFKNAAHSLAELEAAKAHDSFLDIDRDVKSLANEADRSGVAAAIKLWGIAIPKLKSVPAAFSNLTALSGAAVILAGSLTDIETNGFNWLLSRKGPEFTARLKTMETSAAQIVTSATALQNHGMELGVPFGADFVNLATELYRTDRFLKAAIRWLEEYREKHILVLFQNHSELRPGGGFLGSFADIVMGPEGIREIKVTDIYDPDGQLDLKVVPPKPLQTITENWGARDANWFFDFPTSAKKIISFLEKSKIYSEQNVSFDATIAMNVRVLQSLLAITGPVTLPEYDFTATAENVLARLQREVETGADKAKGAPKKILTVLAPKILERLATLTPSQKRSLYDAMAEHLRTRDMMFFAKDIEMQNYLEAVGTGGEVTRFPEGAPGEYLAVVAANIAGGKSDAFVTEKIKLSSRIEESGRISNFLTIERAHQGNKANDPWYRATNNSYLQIMTPKGSRLTYFAGNDARTVKTPLPYAKLGYLIDPDVRRIEETAQSISPFGTEELEAFGKTVFATWHNLKASTVRKLEIEYINPVRLPLGAERIPYQFVFERQSGATVSLDFLLEAPPGYHFAENNAAQFNLTDENPAGRIQVALTLVKDRPADPR